MSWINAYFCVKCKKELSNYQKMYSNGRCLECGYKHPDACTIVRTTEKAKRWIHTGKWWQSWKGHWEYKE